MVNWCGLCWEAYVKHNLAKSQRSWLSFQGNPVAITQVLTGLSLAPVFLLILCFISPTQLLKYQLLLENLQVRGKERPAIGGSLIESNVDLGVTTEFSVTDFFTDMEAYVTDRAQVRFKHPYGRLWSILNCREKREIHSPFLFTLF